MMKKFLKYGSLTLLTIVFAAFLLKGRIPHATFDLERWKNWNETEKNTEVDCSLRWDMMNSLRNNHKLKGKTQEEIIRLLGEPESRTEKEFYYSLGMAKSGMEVGTLTIIFDETGKVTKFNVRRS